LVFFALDLDVAGLFPLVLPPAMNFWIGWPPTALIALCWLVLEGARGTLKPSLKKMFLGHGKSFKSDSGLHPAVQALIVCIALGLCAVYVYSRMKH
jgi:hypothetical protein